MRPISLLLFSLLTPAASAATHWISVTTPHFELYTTNNEKSATRAIKVFEHVRYFFLQNSPSKTAPETAIRIIAFKSESEYKPYRVNAGTFAFYRRTRERDYIVLQDLEPENYPAAMHEYTHLVIEHLKLKLPTWLSEGIADLYSSLEPHGNQALVGRPIPRRMNVLLTQPLMDLNALLTVTRDSPAYNERDQMSLFYAQSWVLTHMLALAPDYYRKFPQFFAQISSGTAAAAAFTATYGKTLQDVSADLHKYILQASLRASIFDIRIGKLDLDPRVAPLNDVLMETALAGLLASRQATASEAAVRLGKLAKDHPNNSEIEQELGYLSMDEGQIAEALVYFASAFDHGSTDPTLMFYYAGLLLQTNENKARAMAALQKAIELRPGFDDARLNLGNLAASEKQYRLAVGVLSPIRNVTPETAFQLFYILAYCYAQLNDPKQSALFAEQARKYAKTPGDRSRLDLLDHGH